MTRKDLRRFAMYGLSILGDEAFKDYKESNLTDETANRLWHLYADLWNELYHEELEEQQKNSPMSL